MSQNTFAGNLKLGDAGTIPLGLNAPLNPLGSCHANPQGPVTNGVQLTDITDSPGQVGGGGGVRAAVTANVPPPSTALQPAPVVVSASPAPAAIPAPSVGGFALQNGMAAQALNKQFATLLAGSSCTGASLFPL